MPFAEIRFRSGALDKDSAMYVLLPKPAGARARYPVFYLLHGLSDDHTIWHRRTRIEWYVRDLPLIVVMPDGGRSFYCDAVDGPPYEKYFLEDVVGFVDHFLPTIAERSGRVIGGLSMGGYGALKLGLKRTDLFCSVTAHSGCHAIVRELVEHGTLRGYEELDDELYRIYGKPPRFDDDPFAMAETADRKKLPAIRLDCGVGDYLLQHSRDIHAHFEKLGIGHVYEEFPGEHTWDYWDQHIQEALAFHCRALRIEPSGDR